jgi:hypothetical protein
MGWWRRKNLNGGVLIDEKEIIVNSAGIVVGRKFACYRLPGTNTGSSASTGTGPSASTCTRAGTSTNTNTGSRGLRVGITISHPRGRPPYIVFGEMER